MRNDWKYLPLGDIVEIKRGLTYSKNDEVETSEKIVLRSNNINLDNHQFDFTELKYLIPSFDIPADKYLQKGDLLMCMSNGSKAHLGKVALYEGDSNRYAFGGFMAALSHKDSVIGKYLFYAMTTPMYKEYIKALSDGANINNLKVRDIEAFTIPVPPLSEQERIVSLLDTQFAKIDALKANVASQLQAAKDLFQAALKQLLTPQEGWEKKKLGECFISINNGANIKQTKGAGGIPITRIETLSNGVFNKDRLGYANIDDASRYYKYILKDGDLLMSHINSVEFVGRTVVFHNQLPIVIHGMNLLRLVPNTTAISDFYYYAFKTPWFRLQLEPIIHKSVNQASMNTTALKQVNVYIPNKDTQQEIVARLDSISEKVKALQANYDQTINLCNDLKQSLLKSIFA